MLLGYDTDLFHDAILIVLRIGNHWSENIFTTALSDWRCVEHKA